MDLCVSIIRCFVAQFHNNEQKYCVKILISLIFIKKNRKFSSKFLFSIFFSRKYQNHFDITYHRRIVYKSSPQLFDWVKSRIQAYLSITKTTNHKKSIWYFILSSHLDSSHYPHSLANSVQWILSSCQTVSCHQ